MGWNLLNGCKVWSEADYNTLPTLPKSSYPKRPCTSTPRNHDNIGLCNLTPASNRIITCLELLNEWYGVDLGLQKFCMLNSKRKRVLLLQLCSLLNDQSSLLYSLSPLRRIALHFLLMLVDFTTQNMLKCCSEQSLFRQTSEKFARPSRTLS
ncbi:hypothetical protein DVH24_005865 [Malus domestica]|uniref:Uncharacterized protein n=1 Tax=Malus domestica TaxID=3750 RepID=A0A498INT1_MALDO|nr:hypothetical protein DVH24_005865 [Malus domestica]